jgi:folylpolyglutamate synthase/dihydropteroate synthase
MSAEEGGHGKASMDFLGKIVNSLVLFGGLFIVLRKPVKALLAKRTAEVGQLKAEADDKARREPERIAKAAALAAVRETRWEGRLETVRTRPLVLLDGAHNIEGVTVLADHVKKIIGRRVVLVFAAMEDKDLRAMTRMLFPVASTVVLTRIPYKRSATPEALLAAAPAFKGPVFLEPDTRKAVELALSLSGKPQRKVGAKRGTSTFGACPRSKPAPVVIAGSLFLIGEVKRLRLFA